MHFEKLEEAVYDLERYISPGEASKITGCTKTTIIDWCRKYKIGHQVGTRWRIDPDKLALLLRGANKGDYND